MVRPTISVIIPAFNEEEYLPVCLDSIYTVNYPKELIEIIVVDNGSTDKTQAIAHSFGAKVLCDDSKNVSGLRNLGASESNGDILAFVDADCIVSKNWLINTKDYYERDDVSAWGSPPIIPDNATWVQQTWYLVRKKDEIPKAVEWLESMNLFVRRSTFEKIGGFNETLVTCEDVDFCYRLTKYGSIYSDNEIEVTHLGEAKTVWEFFKKELWRGRSNFAGILSHGISFKEIPSLSIPLYFGVFLPALLVLFFVTKNITWLYFSGFLYIAPSFYVAFKKSKKTTVTEFFKLIYILNVYFLTRTIAILNYR